jgi:hypothetical protein
MLEILDVNTFLPKHLRLDGTFEPQISPVGGEFKRKKFKNSNARGSARGSLH